jgi:hypothetical protein
MSECVINLLTFALFHMWNRIPMRLNHPSLHSGRDGETIGTKDFVLSSARFEQSPLSVHSGIRST